MVIKYSVQGAVCLGVEFPPPRQEVTVARGLPLKGGVSCERSKRSGDAGKAHVVVWPETRAVPGRPGEFSWSGWKVHGCQ